MKRSEALTVLGLKGSEDRFQIRSAALRAEEQLAQAIESAPGGTEKDRLSARRQLIENAVSCLLEQSDAPAASALPVAPARVMSEQPQRPVPSTNWIVPAALAIAVVAGLVSIRVTLVNTQLERRVEKLNAIVAGLDTRPDPLGARISEVEAEQKSIRARVEGVERDLRDLSRRQTAPPPATQTTPARGSAGSQRRTPAAPSKSGK